MLAQISVQVFEFFLFKSPNGSMIASLTCVFQSFPNFVGVVGSAILTASWSLNLNVCRHYVPSMISPRNGLRGISDYKHMLCIVELSNLAPYYLVKLSPKSAT